MRDKNLERARKWVKGIRERVRTGNWGEFPETMDSFDCTPAVAIPLALIAALLADVEREARLGQSKIIQQYILVGFERHQVIDFIAKRIAELERGT